MVFIHHFSFFFLTCNIPILDLDHKCIERLITLFLNNWLLIDLSPTSVRMMDLQRVLFPKYSHQASQQELAPPRQIQLGEPISIQMKLELQYRRESELILPPCFFQVAELASKSLVVRGHQKVFQLLFQSCFSTEQDIFALIILILPTTGGCG